MNLDGKIEIDDNGCWVWQLYIDPKGYGRISVNGKRGLAHRVVYQELVGPIPAGLTIDHLCRNRACVNPDHLEPVTNRENVLRGKGVTATNAQKTHCDQGHELLGDNLIKRNRPGRDCRTCANARRKARRKEAKVGRH